MVNSPLLLVTGAAAVLAISLLFLMQNGSAQNQRQLDSYFRVSNVTVSGSGTARDYSVYVASNYSQQAQGYMNQTSLGDCTGRPNCLGMLFVFGYQGDECFWMKNTEIALKQLWISDNGVVTYSANAIPYSTTSICASGSMVLETSPVANISVGDKIILAAH